MLKLPLIFILLVIGLAALPAYGQGKGYPGYLITQKSDTVYGEVRVPKMNWYRGELTFNGINLEKFHAQVLFRESGSYFFQPYKPEEISGFGFSHKSIDYVFRSFVLELKSMVRGEGKTPRFLNLVYTDGTVFIFKDLNRKVIPTSTSNLPNTYLHFDYYLFSNAVGLSGVDTNGGDQYLADLLALYQLDKRIWLKYQPEKKN